MITIVFFPLFIFFSGKLFTVDRSKEQCPIAFNTREKPSREILQTTQKREKGNHTIDTGYH